MVGFDGGEAVGLDDAGGEADAEDGEGGVDCLGEDVGGEGKRADVVEHLGRWWVGMGFGGQECENIGGIIIV